MIPEIVAFDLGKVFVDFDFNIAVAKIAARCHKSLSAVQECINASPLLHRYESGLLSNEQFFREACASTGFGGSFDEFAHSFSDIFTLVEPMVDINAQLRARGIPTYILSNTNDLAIAHIRKSYPFFAHFDGYVFSYQHGVMKPDPQLYKVLEALSGRSGNQIVYLDDRLENIESAKALGWQVIHHLSPEQSLAALRKVGLLQPRPVASE